MSRQEILAEHCIWFFDVSVGCGRQLVFTDVHDHSQVGENADFPHTQRSVLWEILLLLRCTGTLPSSAVVILCRHVEHYRPRFWRITWSHRKRIVIGPLRGLWASTWGNPVSFRVNLNAMFLVHRLVMVHYHRLKFVDVVNGDPKSADFGQPFLFDLPRHPFT